MRPHSSTVFQQKLQLSGGPARTAGVWLARACGGSSPSLSTPSLDVDGCRSITVTARMRSDPTSWS